MLSHAHAKLFASIHLASNASRSQPISFANHTRLVPVIVPHIQLTAQRRTCRPQLHNRHVLGNSRHRFATNQLVVVGGQSEPTLTRSTSTEYSVVLGMTSAWHGVLPVAVRIANSQDSSPASGEYYIWRRERRKKRKVDGKSRFHFHRTADRNGSVKRKRM